MRLTRLLPIIVLFFFAVSHTAQVSFLHGEDWEEAKEISLKSGNPIFIDFYTTWCGPCKKMDKTTFVDSTVSAILNGQFVSLKLDAEKEINKNLVKRYKIRAYPTFLFLNSNGEVLTTQTGYKSPEEFERICTNLLLFVETELYAKLQSDNIENISDEELEHALTLYGDYNFKAKSSIKRKYYDQLKQGENISTAVGKYLLLNHESNEAYYLLTKLIPDTIQITDKFNWNREFEKLYDVLFDQAIASGDRGELDQTSKYYLETFERLNTARGLSPLIDLRKEIRSHRLTFYKKNNQSEEYYMLADSLINEYILPHDVDKVHRYDKRMLEGSKWMRKKLGEDEEDLIMYSAKDSLFRVNSTAVKMITRLNEIAENVWLNTEDEAKLLKALKWMDRSKAYLDLPEAHIISAAILKKLGRTEESANEITLAKSSRYFDKESENKIIEFDL